MIYNFFSVCLLAHYKYANFYIINFAVILVISPPLINSLITMS